MRKEKGRKQAKRKHTSADSEKVDTEEVRGAELITAQQSTPETESSPELVYYSDEDVENFWRQNSFEDKLFSLQRCSPSVYDTVDHFTEISYLIRDSFFRKKASIFGHYIPLVSVPQYGSRCGFVALSMASQIFKPVGARKLFDAAKGLGLTNIGEMFDAYEMAKFASMQLQCKSMVMYDLPARKYELLSHICDGWPILIPYDQYGSFPGTYRGEKAHWAVLNGLFFSVGMTIDPGRQLRYVSTTRGDYIKERLLYDCRRCTPDSEIFLLAREGTREQLLAWRLDELLISNGNLEKMSAKFGLERSYELPNLRDKAVLLQKMD